MIVEGILGTATLVFIGVGIMKLIDQAKLKKLKAKYPEGTETIARPVQNMRPADRNSLKEAVINAPIKRTPEEERLIADRAELVKQLTEGKSNE